MIQNDIKQKNKTKQKTTIVVFPSYKLLYFVFGYVPRTTNVVNTPLPN